MRVSQFLSTLSAIISPRATHALLFLMCAGLCLTGAIRAQAGTIGFDLVITSGYNVRQNTEEGEGNSCVLGLTYTVTSSSGDPLEWVKVLLDGEKVTGKGKEKFGQSQTSFTNQVELYSNRPGMRSIQIEAKTKNGPPQFSSVEQQMCLVVQVQTAVCQFMVKKGELRYRASLSYELKTTKNYELVSTHLQHFPSGIKSKTRLLTGKSMTVTRSLNAPGHGLHQTYIHVELENVSFPPPLIDSILCEKFKPPKARNDRFTVPDNVPTVLDVLAQDDPGDGGALSIVKIIDPPPVSQGTVSISDDQLSLLFTPGPDAVGELTFRYRIKGSFYGRDNAKVTLTIEKPPECVPNPSVDLQYSADTVLTIEGHTARGHLVNTSSTCTYKVGLAAYRKHDEKLVTQTLFAADVQMIEPGQTLDLGVEVPDCAAQIDLFYGELLQDFKTERYGERLIKAVHINGKNFCPLP